MILLTEQQRLDAIKACEGIEAANAKVQQACKSILEIFERAAQPMKQPAEKPKERFTVGRQPCQAFLRGDADIAALGEGNRRNLHQCPTCYGNRAWCDACHADHHDGGWETCKPLAYDYREED